MLNPGHQLPDPIFAALPFSHNNDKIFGEIVKRFRSQQRVNYISHGYLAHWDRELVKILLEEKIPVIEKGGQLFIEQPLKFIKSSTHHNPNCVRV